MALPFFNAPRLPTTAEANAPTPAITAMAIISVAPLRISSTCAFCAWMIDWFSLSRWSTPSSRAFCAMRKRISRSSTLLSSSLPAASMRTGSSTWRGAFSSTRSARAAGTCGRSAAACGVPTERPAAPGAIGSEGIAAWVAAREYCVSIM